MHKILASLNKKQREAAEALEGPVLILAGAGSGKTKTLVHRIAYLIDYKEIKPQNILAVTFTNKAAQEMKARIKKLLPKNAKDMPMMGTFHAVCAQILRKEISVLGYSKNFVIFDEHDSMHLIKKVIKDLGYDIKDISPRAIAVLISRAKNELLSEDTFSKQAGDTIEKIAAEAYHQYQAELKEHNALDFDDLILKTVFIMEKYPEVLKKYQKLFKYILVDEYQDTNQAQYILIKLLAMAHRNICVVGDDYQSIYAWRGANMRNILNFEKDYPDAKVILLEQNYRSTKNILYAANEVIKYNINQKDKKLWTENPTGSKLTIKEASDEKDEGEYIIKEILGMDTKPKKEEEIVYEAEDTLIDKILKSAAFKVKKKDTKLLNEVKDKLKKVDLAEYVILYRTNAQSRALEESFLKYGVPYRIIGGIKFYERKEIKDMICYMRVLINPNDWVSLERVVNEPTRGLGHASFIKIEKQCREKGKNFLDITEKDLPPLTPRTLNSFLTFQKTLKELHQALKKSTATKMLDLILEKTGYKKALEQDAEFGETRLENILEIKTVTKKFDHLKSEEGINRFLEEVSLVSDQDEIDENLPAVNLMTIHAAKGLEFPKVFIAGAEEGLFPHSRSLFEPEQLEEERRLCYVAITRAKQKVYIVYASQRQIYGSTQVNSPSRFIDDLPEDAIAKE
ncbi:MAG: UvrD-helicase domain-containing protein [Patescibacteria group bacterium]|jgi:DNA helicase-2/ATP-dependent DNA helicase PcrA